MISKTFSIMKKEYTIKELSDIYSVSTRTIVRHLDSLILKEKNKILIPYDVVKLLEVRHNYDTSKTEVRQDYHTSKTPENEEETESDFDIVEGFTMDEYQEFQKRLVEYPLIKKDLEYHRKSAKSHQRQMELILRNLEQRNFIEAKDKKLE
jgi:DNA-binding MarR family transcriptional regulator